MNSKQKGKRGELEFSRKCREEGYDTHRGQQYNGADGSADVVGLPGIHVEVKRTEALRLYDAMAQAISDARPGELPVVAHRRNDSEWLMAMRLKDWFRLFREWDASTLPFSGKPGAAEQDSEGA